MSPGLAVHRLDATDLERLFHILAGEGYSVIGPMVREGTVIYDRIASSRDLPIGWADEQTNGSYRLVKTDSPGFFGFSSIAQSWKKFLVPPSQRLFRSQRQNGTFEIIREENVPERLAFLGVRPCDLRAIAILDTVHLNGPVVDPDYRARRNHALIIAVNCTKAGNTCFCASMGSGPEAGAGFDLCLTELLRDGDHCFLVESGSPKGDMVVESLALSEATPEDRSAGREAVRKAAQSMGRALQTDGLAELLAASLSHRRWDEIGRRCLACANCTMVCPTCFCTTVEDGTDLTGTIAWRTKLWDSCFTSEFSYIHGGSVRQGITARYRQWMTHKLSSWVEQFGTFGCVGCGRCITWCPVGIDLTEEAAIFREQTSLHA